MATETGGIHEAEGLRGVETLTRFGATWFETMGEIGQEMMSFVTRRMQEDMRCQSELMRARDLAEVQRVQSRFLQTAMTQYGDETARILELCRNGLGQGDDKSG